MSKNFAGTGYSKGHMDGVASRSNYGATSSSSGNGFPKQGTYDYEAAKALDARVEARRAGEESQRAYEARQIEKQQERAAWNEKLKQLKADASTQGCKTVKEKFADAVKEADDLIRGKKVYTPEEKAELAEELLTGISVGDVRCAHGLVRLIEQKEVRMMDTDGQRGLFKVYDRLSGNNPAVSNWLVTKEQGWDQYKKENAETLFNNLYKAIVKLDPNQPLSDELLKFTRKHFEEKAEGATRGLLSLEFEEYVDPGFGIQKTHKSFFEHPGLHEVGGGYNDDSLDLAGDHDTSAGDAGCFGGCSIM